MSPPTELNPTSFSSVQWLGETNGHLRLLDQTVLPSQVCYVDCHDVESVWEAIRGLRVRGAPAIGIAAAYGLLLAFDSRQSLEDALIAFREAAERWPPVVRLQSIFLGIGSNESPGESAVEFVKELAEKLLAEARSIHHEDRQMCQRWQVWCQADQRVRP